MIAAIADTHTIIWHINADVRLSPQAKQTIEHAGLAGNTIGFSVITLIEMIYLGEKQRIAPTTFQAFSSRVMTGKTVFLEIPLDYRIAGTMQQIDRNQISDMPDRIIAATALTLEVPLITCDGKIRQSHVPTIW